jgi:lysophospholipase L1-like esterase
MKTSATLLFCCIALAGCGQSGSDTSTPSAAIITSSTAAQTSSAQATNDAAFTGANSRLIGRFDTSATGKAQFTWPGSAIEFSFEGSNASINLHSAERVRFEVNVNGEKKTLWVDASTTNYPLATDLAAGKHTIRLTRVSESSAGVTALTSDPQTDGQLLAAPQAPDRQLLVIGDSITAGYGVEGDSAQCKYSLDTSTQQLTYAALAAQKLQADLQAIAWSGIGAWRAYGEETPTSPTILTRYQRTLANDENSRWDVTQYQPDAVIINIGTNDFWQGSVTEAYSQGMSQLIAQVQSDYAGKPVYLMVSPMLGGEARSSQTEILLSLTNEGIHLLDAGKIEAEDGLGCDYHPNLTTQQRLADAVGERLAKDLGWQ